MDKFSIFCKFFIIYVGQTVKMTFREHLDNYFFASDLSKNLEDSNHPNWVRSLGRYACSSLVNFASLGAVYHFRNEPESMLIALGVTENLRVWSKLALSSQ